MKILLALLIFLAAGCATKPLMPLQEQSAEPDWTALRISAGQIKHPLLRPVVFDERDGLSLDEVAILAVLSNPDLRAIRDQQALGDAQLLQAGILPNPQLSFDVAHPVGGDTRGTVNALGLGLDWQMAALISRSARRDAAQLHSDSVALDVAWDEWQGLAGADGR